MNRIEVLRQGPEQMFINLADKQQNLAKWLTTLMVIDAETKEIKNTDLKPIDKTKFTWR